MGGEALVAGATAHRDYPGMNRTAAAPNAIGDAMKIATVAGGNQADGLRTLAGEGRTGQGIKLNVHGGSPID